MDLRQRGEYTDDLFAETQPAASERVMGVLDAINAKWGRNTLRPGRVTTAPDWGMRREMMSQSFTTRLDQLWEVEQVINRSSNGGCAVRSPFGFGACNQLPLDGARGTGMLGCILGRKNIASV